MNTIRRLFTFMRPYWLPAVLAPLLMALEVSMDLLQPRFMQTLVDVGVARHDTAFVLHIWLRRITAALVGVIGGVGCTIASTIAGRIVELGTHAELLAQHGAYARLYHSEVNTPVRSDV